jgi:succinyl-diaminopimelate desuccinylase
MDSTLALTCELIQRPSVTPEDSACQTLMAERLEAIGFISRPMPFGEVSNLWASRGSSGPTLVFAGHTDVVPTGPVEQWQSPPFTPTIRDGYLFGRGAADMKASLAAMITACERFVVANPNHKGRIAFLITSDEEGPAHDGTVKVIEQLASEGEAIDWCVIGEPSSTAQLGDVIKNGRRGSQGARLTIYGKQGHIAYPHLADNPIHKALAALSGLIEQHWDEGNEFFPATQLQISNIHGGTGATNVIPGEVVVDFNLRYSSETTAEDLEQKITALLDEFNIDYHIDWVRSGKPFLTRPGQLTQAVTTAVQKVCGITPELSTSGGTSDGRFIAPYDIDVIELGPINATIHQIDECVAVEDVERLSLVYEEVLVELLS